MHRSSVALFGAVAFLLANTSAGSRQRAAQNPNAAASASGVQAIEPKPEDPALKTH